MSYIAWAGKNIWDKEID